MIYERKKKDLIRRQMRCLQSIIFAFNISGNIKRFSCWCGSEIRTFDPLSYITFTTITCITTEIPRRKVNYSMKNFDLPKMRNLPRSGQCSNAPNAIPELRMGRAGLSKTSPWENSFFISPAHALTRMGRPMGAHGLITTLNFLFMCIFNLNEIS